LAQAEAFSEFRTEQKIRGKYMILILGRFQPFHNGHLKVVKDAFEKDKSIVIAIGSSQKKDEKDNPFSDSERKEMIAGVLKSERILAKIVTVPDIPCDSTYVDHVAGFIGGRPKKVITENPWTVRLFKDAGIDVEVTPRYMGISATEIRKRIAEGAEWESMVPKDVVAFIRKIKGVDRIRKLLS
jgi:nicotinamide-nucleotide adenylyltransferase